jgi:hypothetical protein
MITLGMMEDLLGPDQKPPKMFLDMAHVPPRVDGHYIRDEELQARELVDQLGVLDEAGLKAPSCKPSWSPTPRTAPTPGTMPTWRTSAWLRASRGGNVGRVQEAGHPWGQGNDRGGPRPSRSGWPFFGSDGRAWSDISGSAVGAEGIVQGGREILAEH